jgi:virulence-associated protein VapD
LKALPWFPASIRDLRAFKVEHWSDFTSLVKA